MLRYIDFVTNNDEEFLNSFKDVKIENGKLDVNEVMDTCNYRLGNRIICSNNTIIIDDKKMIFDPKRYLVFDWFILDKVDKKIIDLYDGSFKDTIGKIDFLFSSTNEFGDTTVFINNNICIKTDDRSRMFSYTNLDLDVLPDGFLYNHMTLEELQTPVLTKIGNKCLSFNDKLESINLNKCKSIGTSFLQFNKTIKSLNMPNVETIDDDFLKNNNSIENINLPSLKEVKNNFLLMNNSLKNINIPALSKTGEGFLASNYVLNKVNAPVHVKLSLLKEVKKKKKVVKKIIKNSMGGAFLEDDLKSYESNVKSRAFLKSLKYMK